jgi:hypothetical protein
LSRRLIVGVLCGRTEVGPRALGHRSLIAYPDSEAIKASLNRLKGREWCAVALVRFRSALFGRLTTASHDVVPACPFDDGLPGLGHCAFSYRSAALAAGGWAGLGCTAKCGAGGDLLRRWSRPSMSQSLSRITMRASASHRRTCRSHRCTSCLEQCLRAQPPTRAFGAALQHAQHMHSSTSLSALCSMSARARSLLPAVAHLDGTARVQTVTADGNPWLHDLLLAVCRAWNFPRGNFHLHALRTAVCRLTGLEIGGFACLLHCTRCMGPSAHGRLPRKRKGQEWSH